MNWGQPEIPESLRRQLEASLRMRGLENEGHAELPAEPEIKRMATTEPAPPYADPRETVARMRMPETVEPVNAPDVPRMGQADITGDYRRASFDDPVMRPLARRDIGVDDSESDYLDRPINVPTEPTRPIVKRGGFGGTFRNIGAGLSQGLAIGAPMGGGQAIGAGLVGAILGGVNPQAIANLKFERMTKPKYEREKSAAEEEIAKREQLIDRIGKRTGFDPMTGTEMPERADRREDREVRRMGVENSEEDRKRRRQQDESQERERVASVAVQRAVQLKQPVPMAAVRGTSLEGYGGMIPPTKEASGAPHFVPETGGRMIWDSEKQRMVPTPGSEALGPRRDPNELTPNEDRQQQNYETDKAESAFEKAHKDVQTLTNLNAELKRTDDDWRTVKAEADAIRAARDQKKGASDAAGIRAENEVLAEEQTIAAANEEARLKRDSHAAYLKNRPGVHLHDDGKGNYSADVSAEPVQRTRGSGRGSQAINYQTAKQKAQEVLTEYLSRPGRTEADKQRAQAAFQKHFGQ